MNPANTSLPNSQTNTQGTFIPTFVDGSHQRRGGRQLLAVAHAAPRDRRVHLDLYPDVAGEGTRLFDDVPKSYQL